MRKLGISVLAGVCGASLFVFAEDKPAPSADAMMQEVMKAMQPGEKHAILKSFSGTWKVVIKSTTPDGKPMTEEGESVNTLINDGRFLKQEFKGTMMGQPFTGIGYLGYDNSTGKYQSFWLDSMNTSMTILEGAADASGKVLTFGGHVSCPVTKAKIPCKGTMTLVSDTEHTFSMTMPDPTAPGKDHTMEMTYTKAKAGE